MLDRIRHRLRRRPPPGLAGCTCPEPLPAPASVECPRHGPYGLWQRATREVAEDESVKVADAHDAARRRYAELMRLYGHLIPGDGRPAERQFPCGWGDREHPRDDSGRFR